jgi:hypothetical protein
MSAEFERHGGEPGAQADSAAHERSEQELRAAYEEELNRITSAELMLQAVVSLLNLGGRRLGPPPGAPPGEGGEPAAAQRDLEQVRDAIDGVRALLGVLDRRLSKELGPLRDALSQLQIAYAREAQAAAAGPPGAASGAQGGGPAADHDVGGSAEQKDAPKPEGASDSPGPAESSGRLWVPGR